MIIKAYVVVRFSQNKAGAGIMYRAEEYGSVLEKRGYYYLYESSRELSYINALRLVLESIKSAYNQYKIVIFCDDDDIINRLQSNVGSDHLLEVSKLKKKMSEFRDLELSTDLPVEFVATCGKLAMEACATKMNSFLTYDGHSVGDK